MRHLCDKNAIDRAVNAVLFEKWPSDIMAAESMVMNILRAYFEGFTVDDYLDAFKSAYRKEVLDEVAMKENEY